MNKKLALRLLIIVLSIMLLLVFKDLSIAQRCIRHSDCEDGNVCTHNWCENIFCKISYPSLPCDDGRYCNGIDTCSEGTCSVHSGNPCPDGTLCDETAKRCNEIECWTDEDCNDDNPCTNDICEILREAQYCLHLRLDSGLCDDGRYCNGIDTCSEGTCSVHSGNPCPDGTLCDETAKRCNEIECWTDEDCDDGFFCNGTETCVKEKCKSGSNPCPDDGLFCNGEEGCNEEKDKCLHSGDPCAKDLICDEEDDVCVGCLDDNDCDDGLWCNGLEICEDGVCQEGDAPCPDDDLYCTGIEDCDEDDGVCTQSGDPCPEGTTCFEENDECRPIAIPNVLAEPDPVFQSRWIPLLVFLNITGQDGAHFDESSSVIFTPSSAVLALPMLLDEENISIMGLLMPQWLTGQLESIGVTVITGTQEAPGSFQIQLLPFFLDEDKEFLSDLTEYD